METLKLFYDAILYAYSFMNSTILIDGVYPFTFKHLFTLTVLSLIGGFLFGRQAD